MKWPEGLPEDLARDIRWADDSKASAEQMMFAAWPMLSDELRRIIIETNIKARAVQYLLASAMIGTFIGADNPNKELDPIRNELKLLSDHTEQLAVLWRKRLTERWMRESK